MLIAIMIGEGHLDAENYGYSFFKIALVSLQVKQLQAIQTLAAGIGQAFDEGGGKELQTDIDRMLATKSMD